MDDLCSVCLCSGRKVKNLTESGVYKIYVDMLDEIPLNVVKLKMQICWECEVLMHKYNKFRRNVQDCYQELVDYSLGSLGTKLTPRPSQLKCFQLESFEYNSQETKYAENEIFQVSIEEENKPMLENSDTRGSLKQEETHFSPLIKVEANENIEIDKYERDFCNESIGSLGDSDLNNQESFIVKPKEIPIMYYNDLFLLKDKTSKANIDTVEPICNKHTRIEKRSGEIETFYVAQSFIKSNGNHSICSNYSTENKKSYDEIIHMSVQENKRVKLKNSKNYRVHSSLEENNINAGVTDEFGKHTNVDANVSKERNINNCVTDEFGKHSNVDSNIPKERNTNNCVTDEFGKHSNVDSNVSKERNTNNGVTDEFGKHSNVDSNVSKERYANNCVTEEFGKHSNDVSSVAQEDVNVIKLKSTKTDIDLRLKIVSMHKMGKSLGEISRVVGKSRVTVRAWLRRYKTEGNLELHKPGRKLGSIPPKTLSDSQKQLILNYKRKDSYISIKNFAELFGVTRKTVNNFLKSLSKINGEDIISDEEVNPLTSKVQTKVRRHRQKKSGTTSVECADCGKVFKNKRNLMHHISAHHSNNPDIYKCTHCESRFKYSATMFNHIRICHKDKLDRSLFCVECKRHFTSKVGYQRHIFLKHAPESEYIFECEICNRRLLDKNSLRRHLIAEHSKYYTYKCSQCNEEFESQKSLSKHKTFQHLKKKHLCHLCAKQYTEPSALEKHIRVKHNHEAHEET